MFNIALAIAKQDPIRASYLMIHIGFAQYNIKSLTQASETLYKAVKMFMTSAETKLGQECKSKGAVFVDHKSDEELDSMLVSNAAVVGAMLLEDQHSYRKSIKMLKWAYQLDKHMLGDHIKTSTSLSKISQIYSKLGATERAVWYKYLSIKKFSTTGTFNFQLSVEHSVNGITNADQNMCGNVQDNNFQIIHEHSLEVKHVLYKVHQTILDHRKNWNNEFDLFVTSKETEDNILSNDHQPLLDIALVGTNKNIDIFGPNEKYTTNLNCQLAAKTMNEILLSHTKFEFSKTVSLANEDVFNQYTEKISKQIIALQGTLGNSIKLSLMKFLLGQLHMANGNYWNGLKLFQEAAEILVELEVLQKREPSVGAETLHEYILSSILLYGSHFQMQNISVTSLSFALKHHLLLGNTLEVSQIYLGLARATKEHNYKEASIFFSKAIKKAKYWKLSVYFKMFLSTNEQRKQEAQQAYEYGLLASQLGYQEESVLLFQKAFVISKKVLYINNCEPLLYQYSFFQLVYGKGHIPSSYQQWLDLENMQPVQTLCGLSDIDHQQLLRAVQNKYSKLEMLKETLSPLGFDQSTTLHKHFIKTVEIIQQGLVNNDKFQPTLNGSLSYSQMELIAAWAFNIGERLQNDHWHHEGVRPVDDALFIYTHFLNESIETAKTLVSIAKIYRYNRADEKYISTMKLSMAMRLNQTVFTCDEWKDIPLLVNEISRFCITTGKHEEASIFIQVLFDLYRLLQQNCPTIDADSIIFRHICGSLNRFHEDHSKGIIIGYVDIKSRIKLLEGIITQLSGNYQKEMEHVSGTKYTSYRYPAFEGLENKLISMSSDQCHKIATIASRLSLDELNNENLKTLSLVYQEIGLLYYKDSVLEKAAFAFNESLKIRLQVNPELKEDSTKLSHQKYLQTAVLAHALGYIYHQLNEFTRHNILNDSTTPLMIALNIYNQHQLHDSDDYASAFKLLLTGLIQVKNYEGYYLALNQYLKNEVPLELQTHEVLHGAIASVYMADIKLGIWCYKELSKIIASVLKGYYLALNQNLKNEVSLELQTHEVLYGAIASVYMADIKLGIWCYKELSKMIASEFSIYVLKFLTDYVQYYVQILHSQTMSLGPYIGAFYVAVTLTQFLQRRTFLIIKHFVAQIASAAFLWTCLLLFLSSIQTFVMTLPIIALIFVLSLILCDHVDFGDGHEMIFIHKLVLVILLFYFTVLYIIIGIIIHAIMLLICFILIIPVLLVRSVKWCLKPGFIFLTYAYCEICFILKNRNPHVLY